MRQQTNYQEWDADDVRVGIDGEVSNRDVEWERDFKHWDSRGVSDELLNLARPLLEGTPKQRSQAERLLGQAENSFQITTNQRARMGKLLLDHGLFGQAYPLERPTEEELLEAWEASDPRNTSGPTGFANSGSRQADSEG